MTKLINVDKAFAYAKLNYPLFPSDWYITDNFLWNEVFVNEKREYGVPSLETFYNINNSAKEFQKVRNYLKKVMNIHCWLRSKGHNKDLIRQGYKPALHSSHLYGMAIDFDVLGMTPSMVRAKLVEGVQKGILRIRIEANTPTWCHTDCGNKYSGNYKWGLFYP